MEQKLTIPEMLDYLGESIMRKTNEYAKYVDESPLAKAMFEQAIETQKGILHAQEQYKKMYNDTYALYMITKQLDEALN